jgi:hypothetical protein
MKSMATRRMVAPLVVTGLIGLSGCSTFPDYKSKSNASNEAVDKFGSYPVVNRDAIESVNVIQLLDPDGVAKEKRNKEWAALAEGVQWDAAVRAFYDPRYGESSQEIRRNRIQERIITASVQRCNVYKSYLQRKQSNAEFKFGMATTVATVAGALFTPASTVRALSGTGAILSGVRAEYGQAYFGNLAVATLVKAIEARQVEAYKQIQLRGQNQNIKVYPIEAALKDAITYDGMCSLVSALEYSSDAIRAATDPGIERATLTLAKFNKMRQVVDDKVLPEKLEPPTSDAVSLGTNLTGQGMGFVIPDTPTVAWAGLLMEIWSANPLNQSAWVTSLLAANPQLAKNDIAAAIAPFVKIYPELQGRFEVKHNELKKAYDTLDSARAGLVGKDGGDSDWGEVLKKVSAEADVYAISLKIDAAKASLHSTIKNMKETVDAGVKGKTKDEALQIIKNASEHAAVSVANILTR